MKAELWIFHKNSSIDLTAEDKAYLIRQFLGDLRTGVCSHPLTHARAAASQPGRLTLNTRTATLAVP